MERSPAVAGAGIGMGAPGMETVQTVQVANAEAMIPEQPGQGQQTQRPGPEIVGGEIVNPGIDQQQVRPVGAHGVGDPSSGRSGSMSGKYCMEVFFSSRRLNKSL